MGIYDIYINLSSNNASYLTLGAWNDENFLAFINHLRYMPMLLTSSFHNVTKIPRI